LAAVILFAGAEAGCGAYPAYPGTAIGSVLAPLGLRSACLIRHSDGSPATIYEGPDGSGLTIQECRQANADAVVAEQAEQRDRAAATAQVVVPRAKIEPYRPSYSEKVEADNGAVYAVDLSTARHFGGLVQAGVYDLNQGIIIASPMWFQCAYAQVGTDPRLMSYVPPRSVGARLLAIACAEADRHPER
jgi:hypothetical protein